MVNKRPKLSEMTLREKLGQTGMPSPGTVQECVKEMKSYGDYFAKYPFSGLYLSESVKEPTTWTPFETPEAMGRAMQEINDHIKIPILVTADCEYGADGLFTSLHPAGSNMMMGASQDPDLIYKRAYFWARELRSCGVNNPFGPVVDRPTNFFATTNRYISGDHEVTQKVEEALIRGIQDAGLGACAKHYPGMGKDFRDSHFSISSDGRTREEWYKYDFPVWKKAVDSGVMSILTNHHEIPCLDDSKLPGGQGRPATASKKAMDVLRNECGFQGVLYTDAVNMKGMSALFEHEDVYIESFKAGHDIILFVHNDYIDIMEKAYNEGKITMEEIDAAVTRVLDMKEKLGLFDGPLPLNPLTPEENAEFEKVLYDMSKTAQTLVRNQSGTIPFDPKKVKNVAILSLSPDETFMNDDLSYMVKAFEKRGITATVSYRISSQLLEEWDKTMDIIIYACRTKAKFPVGMPFYTGPQLSNLFYSLSYGAKKTVVASFGVPSIYFNYFEGCDMFINCYSSDRSTMEAFVDGILGDFPYVGQSPVELFPRFNY